jgi:tRNA (Thr-GGU) A37 N-methylase
MSKSVEVKTTFLNEYNTPLSSSFYTTLIIIVHIEVIEHIQFIYVFKKTRRVHWIRYLRLHHWVNVSASGIFVPLSISRPVFSPLAHTWFIIYIFDHIIISPSRA